MKIKVSTTKKIFFVLNSLLAIVIIAILYQRFYIKEINFDCQHNSLPNELLKEISAHDIELSTNSNAMLFFFNEVPLLSSMEDIEKLYFKNKGKVSFFVIFTKRFLMNIEMRFPYKMIDNVKFVCSNRALDKNFYLVLKDKKIIYADNGFNLFDMNFMIQKSLCPGKKLNDYQASIGRVKKKIIKSFKKDDFSLLQMGKNSFSRLHNLNEYSQIYFFHLNCSACNIKKILSEIKVKQVVEEKKIAIVFSVLANTYELQSLIDFTRLDTPVFVDYKDHFELVSVISDEKKFPIVINREELEEV
jgi:hypothetical protein